MMLNIIWNKCDIIKKDKLTNAFKRRILYKAIVKILKPPRISAIVNVFYINRYFMHDLRQLSRMSAKI